MKSYPSIPGQILRGTPFYIFDKLDGSNVRAEFSRKRGLHKFGKRNGLLSPDWDPTPHLAEAPGLMMEKYGDDLARICREQRWDKATFYFEFFGPNSFAGWHVEEPHDVVLIDVAVHRKGFLPPKDFINLFDDLHTAELLHHGNFTRDLQEAVENGTLEGMTFEGVVCKGQRKTKKGAALPLMFKRKNIAWIQALREKCGDDEKLFEKLK